MTNGYALHVAHEGIDIATVSGTRRAAMVNAMVARYGIGVMAGAEDADIEDAFNAYKPSKNHTIVAVVVSLKGGSQ